MDTSADEPGERGSLSSGHCDIGIPIHFQEDSGIVTLWSIEFRLPLEWSNGCETPCLDEADTLGFLSGLQRGFRYAFTLWDERRAWIKDTAGKLGLLLSQSLSGSIALETGNTGSFSHPECGGKTALEVLVEIWLTSSVKDRESALILRRYGVHGAFLQLLYWN